MALLCVYLFAHQSLEDCLLIWSAKTSSMDANGSIDIQLLCGTGLEKTKNYLEGYKSTAASAALTRLNTSIETGDFQGFDPIVQSERGRAGPSA